MPYKKNYRKRNYRKRGAKKAPYHRKKAKYQKAVITRMRGAGFSDSVFVRLNYVAQLVLAPGAAITQYTFRGNSLFDPDYTSTGHQPLYFDQYAAIYNRYRVMGSSIRIDCVNTSSTCASYFICVPTTDILTATSISQIVEQNRSKSPKILPISQRGPEGRLKQYCSTRKACGLVKKELFDDTLSSLVGANPSQVWYWNLIWGSTDESTPVLINAIVKMTFYAQFYDRANPTQS